MEIWKYGRNSNKYQCLVFKDNSDDCSRLIDYPYGQRIGDKWITFEVEIEEKRKKSDTPSLNGYYVISEKAASVLKDLIENDVELLPIKFNDETYYYMNIIYVLDCINHEKAIKANAFDYAKYSFKQEIVKGKHIFRTKENLFIDIFVSGEFRNRVVENKLAGFELTKVWDSEEE